MYQGTMPRYSVPSQVCPRSEETTVRFPQWAGKFQQKQMPLGGGLEAEPREGEGRADRNNLRLRLRPTQWTAQPSVGCGVKLMERPLRIPSCEVLGAGQRTQTLTCPALAQWPKISGWSLPHSGSTTRGLLEGPAPSSWTIA